MSMANNLSEVGNLSLCSNKRYTPSLCGMCRLLRLPWPPPQICIHCIPLWHKLCHCRLAHQANLQGSVPLVCEAALPQGKVLIPKDFYAEAHSEPVANSFPSLVADWRCEGFSLLELSWEATLTMMEMSQLIQNSCLLTIISNSLTTN